MSAMNGLSTLIRAGLVSAAIALVAPPVIAQEIDHSRIQMPAHKPMPNPPAESIHHTAMDHTGKDHSSAERRVGKECVSTCRSRWSVYHDTQHRTDVDEHNSD